MAESPDRAGDAGRSKRSVKASAGGRPSLPRVVAERLDAVSTRLGHSMEETTRRPWRGCKASTSA